MPYANHICEDLFMPMGFRVLWSYDHHSCLVWVFISHVCSMDEQTFDFEIDSSLIRPECMKEFGDQAYMQAYIKYDACSNFNQFDTHLCGQEAYVQHLLLVQYLWTRARELMMSCPDAHEVDHYEDPLGLVGFISAKDERFNRPPVPVTIPTGGT